ncbi:unnamed protein product [Clavelina lepadiformis]|uniref:nucleoside-diphosphate kinase n=1 Tax=Clavelina lepadiformis TaxID=159417 RepID=A0ABP0FZ31_CLALP
MSDERTFIAVKPDGVQRGLIGKIICRFEEKGFKLVAMKMLTASQELLEQHYADLSTKPFFKGLVKFMASGPVVAMVWEGKGVVATGRVMLGETNPAQSRPGTIRGDFCIDIGRNICHGSDSDLINMLSGVVATLPSRRLIKISCLRCQERLFSLFSSHHFNRNVRAAASQKSNPSQTSDKRFKLLYRLPQMSLVYSLSRMKIYQTAFFGFTTPLAYYNSLTAGSSLFAAHCLLGVATIATCSLFCFSHYTKRMIGLMWVDDDVTNIKIAYLTFWARRKDIVVPVKSVKPLNELMGSNKKLLVKIFMNDSNDFYFISLRFGNISDVKTFQRIFGNSAL